MEELNKRDEDDAEHAAEQSEIFANFAQGFAEKTDLAVKSEQLDEFYGCEKGKQPNEVGIQLTPLTDKLKLHVVVAFRYRESL